MKANMSATVIATLLLTVAAPAQPTFADDIWNAAAETLVVFNSDYPGSAELANYYAEKRHIPKERLVGLHCPKEDSISRTDFETLVRAPLLKTCLEHGWSLSLPSTPPAPGVVVNAASASKEVRVLVLMRGMPFQVRRSASNVKQAEEDEASVDSELTVLGLNSPPSRGAMRNPYFDQPGRFHLSPRSAGLLIVGRLDGPDDATVRRMIDDAIATETEGLLGRAVIDLALKSGAYQEGEDWLKRSAEALKRAGLPVYIDRSEPLIPDHWPLPETAIYFGWYTDHIQGALASPEFRFERGAIACHLHSFSAGVIRSHDQAWVGPLLSKGAAVTFGNVFEPYLALTIHFDIVTKRLLEGVTVGEAAWNATPALSWMNVVLGDPLYRPFARGTGLRLGIGPARDYALYQGTVQRMSADTDSQIMTTLAQMAEKRHSPHLLELTALLSALGAKPGAAADLLEHAESSDGKPTDLLRLRLYRAEMLQQAGLADQARQLLRQTIKDEKFANLPGKQAAENLLKRLGG